MWNNKNSDGPKTPTVPHTTNGQAQSGQWEFSQWACLMRTDFSSLLYSLHDCDWQNIPMGPAPVSSKLPSLLISNSQATFCCQATAATRILSTSSKAITYTTLRCLLIILPSPMPANPLHSHNEPWKTPLEVQSTRRGTPPPRSSDTPSLTHMRRQGSQIYVFGLKKNPDYCEETCANTG